VVAATTEGRVRRERSVELTTIAANPAVERRLISATIASPRSVFMNAWPSCTAQGSRCRLPSAGSTGFDSLGKSVCEVASTPGSPGACSFGVASSARAVNDRPVASRRVARRTVGLAPTASISSVIGAWAAATATEASSPSCAPLRTITRSRPASAS
jgi:hypothetical protein